ncbi:MAG: ABC transporter, permease protein 1 (cluster 5, nickel/peptides/opines), partial [uncultured Solirubrobacteraceae bacterium]
GHLHRPQAPRHDVRHVRRERPDLPHLLQDAQRRSRRPACGQAADGEHDRGDQPGVGLQRPVLRPVREHDREALHGRPDLVRPTRGRRRAHHRRGAAHVLAGHRRRDHLPDPRRRPGAVQRRPRGRLQRPAGHGARAHRHLDPRLPARRADELLHRLQARLAAGGRLRHDRGGRPLGVVQAPADAVDRARGALHRRVLARGQIERARHDQRRLRAHRAREGPERARRALPSRAAQLDDPRGHAVGPRLRLHHRWRRHPHRERLRHPGDRQLLLRVDPAPRRPAGARCRPVRRVLHRAAQRDRRHRLRVPRPEDPALV